MLQAKKKVFAFRHIRPSTVYHLQFSDAIGSAHQLHNTTTSHAESYGPFLVIRLFLSCIHWFCSATFIGQSYHCLYSYIYGLRTYQVRTYEDAARSHWDIDACIEYIYNLSIFPYFLIHLQHPNCFGSFQNPPHKHLFL